MLAINEILKQEDDPSNTAKKWGGKFSINKGVNDF